MTDQYGVPLQDDISLQNDPCQTGDAMRTIDRMTPAEYAKRVAANAAFPSVYSEFRVWDRKSPRHNWQIVCRTESHEHADYCFFRHATLLRTWGKWPQAQVGMDIVEVEAGGRILTHADFQMKPSNAKMLMACTVGGRPYPLGKVAA